MHDNNSIWKVYLGMALVAIALILMRMCGSIEQIASHLQNTDAAASTKMSTQMVLPNGHTQVEPNQYIVEVIGRYYTDYDAIGAGSSGIIVERDGKTQFLEVDVESNIRGSNFKTDVELPKFLLVSEYDKGTKKIYSPLTRSSL